ncbi:MAG TPA: D-alanine--D-alanine ligase [Petrimonas sp.]|jgi:D-alanine-D-alanine ligase|nr:D-alanine--D-alanine ligase [Petrimonas sp.]
MKKNVAIVWGGYSSEIVISEKSAAGIYTFLDIGKYNLFKVKIDRQAWEVEYQGNRFPVNKNDFSFVADGATTRFDFAYITIHGTPGEDGVLQGYFDMLGIPYSNCGVLASALTFNKFTCNNFLKSFGVKVAPSIVLRERDSYTPEQITAELGLPVFVKPNSGGSSFATTKVTATTKMKEAIEEAFREAPEVIIEQFIAGTEVTCGCYEAGKGIVALPLTEVVPANEFFDFDAKYNGQVEEITPARIPPSIALTIQEETKKIYRLLGAKGIIRADYILQDGESILLEVNTTPGMTGTSFIPQQVEAAGLSMGDVLSDIIETEYAKIHVNR